MHTMITQVRTTVIQVLKLIQVTQRGDVRPHLEPGDDGAPVSSED